jgi:hypothetical protein
LKAPLPTVSKVGLQQRKICPVVFHDDNFTVKDRTHVDIQRVNDRPEPARPVETSPRVDGRLSTQQVNLEAVAVELDFVEIAVALGRIAFHRCQLGLDKTWHRRLRAILTHTLLNVTDGLRGFSGLLPR